MSCRVLNPFRQSLFRACACSLVAVFCVAAYGQAVVERVERDRDGMRMIEGFEKGNEEGSSPKKPDLRKEQFEFLVTPSSLEVLPFQTIRVLQRVTNITREKVGPVAQLLNPSLTVNRHGKFIPLRGWTVAGTAPICMIRCPGPTSPAGLPILYLSPGQSTSLTFPLVTQGSDDRTTHQPSPFFDGIGEVECSFRYYFDAVAYGGRESKYIERRFSVHVVEPQAADRQVFDILSKDLPTAFVLSAYDYGVPERSVAVLEELLRQFPASSYADYIRLALARALWGGDAAESAGVHGDDRYVELNGRHSSMFGRVALVELNWLERNDVVRMRRQYSMLTSDFHFADVALLKAEYLQAQKAPLALKRLDDKLAGMSGTTRARRERILSLLRSIDRNRFPLAPVVTYLLARTIAIDDPQEGAKEYVRLVTDHHNAYEWLRRLEYGVHRNDWAEYRIDPVKQ